jgi:hypothetical protein
VEICGRIPPIEIAAPAKQGSPHHWLFSEAHIGPRYSCGFLNPYVYDYITKLCRQQAEVIQNHENENVLYIGQGEAPYRKYKSLKLGGGNVYDCSSV